jgi:hypothetical protein
MLFHRYVSTERQKLRTAVFIVCLVFSLVNIKKFFIMPPLKGWLHATPITEAHTFTTRSGLVLYVPLNNITLCWDMKLPCTPWPQAGLKLRREGVLESGFILDEPVTVPPLKETLEIIYF